MVQKTTLAAFVYCNPSPCLFSQSKCMRVETVQHHTTRPDHTRPEKMRQDKRTRQEDKTRQDETRPDNTRQDKTTATHHRVQHCMTRNCRRPPTRKSFIPQGCRLRSWPSASNAVIAIVSSGWGPMFLDIFFDFAYHCVSL